MLAGIFKLAPVYLYIYWLVLLRVAFEYKIVDSDYRLDTCLFNTIWYLVAHAMIQIYIQFFKLTFHTAATPHSTKVFIEAFRGKHMHTLYIRHFKIVSELGCNQV